VTARFLWTLSDEGPFGSFRFKNRRAPKSHAEPVLPNRNRSYLAPQRLGAISWEELDTLPKPTCFCPARTALASFEMPERSKRKREDLDADEFTASFFCNLIRQTTGQGVAEFIMDMAQDGKLTDEDLKVLLDKLPSFPESEWEKVARTFGLNPTIDKYQLKPFSTPHAYLPPSFHKRVMKDSIQWLDVYQERGSPKRDAARIRLMDAVCLTNCSFFFYEIDLSLSGMSLCVPFSRAA
jgi:hypothetical protein